MANTVTENGRINETLIDIGLAVWNARMTEHANDHSGKFLPPMIHRASCRPFRWNPLAGDDFLRIYLLYSSSYQVTPGDSDDIVAELRTRRSYSLARMFGSVWILLLSFLIAWISSSLRNPEVAWAILGVGSLGTLTFGGVMVLDFLLLLRLPKVIVAVHNDGRLTFFDGKLELSEYQSLGIRTRWTQTNHMLPTGSRTCTVDLIAHEQGRKHEYQLVATLGSELGPIARRLSTASGIPLVSDLIQITEGEEDDTEDFV